MCSQVGAVASRPHRDRHGWDYLVEFDTSRKDFPADLEPPSQKCFVQIKSSTRYNKDVIIKLSNGIKFANSSLPCFIVLIMFGSRRRNPKIFVRHFWEDEINKCLLSARRAHVDGKKVNRCRFFVKFEEEDRVDENLLEYMKSICTKFSEGYEQRKRDIVKLSGYEDIYATASLIFSREVKAEQFIDLQLGLVDRLPVENLDFKDHRFGLPVSLPHPSGKGFLEVFPKPTKECIVKIIRGNSLDEVNISGGMFFPGIPNLDPDLRKFRVKSGFLDLVVNPKGNISASWETSSDEYRNLTDLLNISSFQSWIRESGVSIQIMIDGVPIFKEPPDLKIDEDNFLWGNIYRFISECVSNFRNRSDALELKFRIDDIIEIIDDIFIFNEYISRNPLPMKGNAKNKLEEIQPSCLIEPCWIEICGTLFVYFVKRSVENISFVDDEFEIFLKNPETMRAECVKGKVDDNIEYINDITKELRNLYISDPGVLFRLL